MLKSVGIAAAGMVAAPMINRGRFRLFASSPKEYSRQAIDLIGRAMTSDDRLAVVSFGQSAAIERSPQSGAFGGFTNEVGREASNLAEAIDKACELLPDVMLMDINMFPVNGFEATRKIIKLCPEVKIIGVSVNDQLGYARNMFQLGAKGFVTKNTSQEEMIEAIFEVHKGRIFLCRELREKNNSDTD